MVFKPINLARQSFVKTFTHGYAQSLVAASQSSTAAQNTSFHTLGNNVGSSLFGKAGPPPVSQNAQQTQPAPSNAGVGVKNAQPDAASNEGGLAAYYAAWQRHRKSEDKELHQFQFAKRIGWKAPTTIPDSQKTKDAVEEAREASRPQAATRSQSYTLGETQRTVEHLTAPVVKLRADNASIAKEISALAPEQDVQTQRTLDASADVSGKAASTASDLQSFSPVQSTKATLVSDGDAYTAHLTLLAEQQQYGNIPTVFEAMLVAGAKPSSSAYNALLLAAINLPRGKHQVASKVLDVYADMLKRRVLPDTSTYAIIVELLAARALDVLAMQKELAEKKTRYGSAGEQGSFMLHSDEIESRILAEDDSLSLAIKLFDTSAAVTTNHIFPAETYRLLITACAETGVVGDMVRIYADMESQAVLAPSAIFAPMISAFALKGDLRSAVECYDEYKALAIAHDKSEVSIVRKDEEVYAAVIKAYATCHRINGGLKFLGKLEDSMTESDRLPLLRDTVALQSLVPNWLSENRHSEAIDYAMNNLSSKGLNAALSAIVVDAADKNQTQTAFDAFTTLTKLDGAKGLAQPAMALVAMYMRQGDAEAAASVWDVLKTQTSTTAFVEPTAMFALSAIDSGNAKNGLQEARSMFAGIRSQMSMKESFAEVSDRIEEAIDVLAARLFNAGTPSPQANVQLLRLMVENETMALPVAESILACIGPEQTNALTPEDTKVLFEVQANVLLAGTALDVGHVSRLAHLFGVLNSTGLVDSVTSKLFERTVLKMGRPDLLQGFQSQVQELVSPATAPAQSFTSTPPSPFLAAPAMDESFDPYGHSTDFRGSAIIADELEKTYGRHSQHLSEALSRFRNIRRAGRHPRYITYAKLINAAAKENQFRTAEEIIAMAKQDVPLVPHNSTVRQGWSTILDSMVGACLTMGRRDVATRYHQDLSTIGAAPSANTFGLSITTLKGSTKVFDEATEAVKIFHQAKHEGVEPSSFLYNALIGKLGKARRIDDCLFYFVEMRSFDIRPTSVTYGTIVNALCRVSDDKFAEELFEEMESMSNYKPRPAPYNSLMQYFLTTKRDRSKVLAYYERMKANNIAPTMHTYKLLIDTYATLEPVNLPAAESIINDIKRSGGQPEAVHYASLIHAKGCVLHDMDGARVVFDSILADGSVKPQACLYQALFESYVANHDVSATESLLETMKSQFVQLTPYIANTLIHGWASAKNILRARSVFESLGRDNREPSTYEAMIRANLAVEDHGNAMKIVGEALRRGYPSAVADKLAALVGGGVEAQY